MLNFFGGQGFHIEADVELFNMLRLFQAKTTLNIIEKIVVESDRDVYQLLHANVVTLEDGIHIGPCTVYATGKLGNGESATVEDGFNKVSYV